MGDQDLVEASRRFVRRARQVVTMGEGLYVLPAVGYSLALLGYYAAYGKLLEFLPAVFFLSVIPVVVVLGRSRDMARYWVPFVTILLSYEALQGVVGSFAASKTIFSVYQVDKLIWGFNVTGWVQSSLSSPLMTDITSIFYTMHFPLVVATSAILWYFGKEIFGKYVVAMVITSYAALVTFIILPTAPPWYQGVALNLYQSSHSAVLPAFFTSFTSLIEADKFAAFPSLHTAYAIIFAYFMVKLDRRLAVVALPIAGGILFSTVYLGQHYLIDIIAGAAYALIPCAISERLHLRMGATARV